MADKIQKRQINRVNIIALAIVVISLISLLTEQSRSYFRTYDLLSGGMISMGWLHVNDTRITDESNNVVALRGANFIGSAFGHSQTRSKEDYAKMADWGFNVVRLPISWQYVEPKPDMYDANYLEKYIDQDLKWAETYGIYVVLDMHQWFWSSVFSFNSSQGSGVPAWGCSNYPNNVSGYQQAVTDFWLGKGPNGTKATETNPSMQDRCIEAWKYVASKCVGHSTIAAFDLFNEPLCGPFMPPTQLVESNSLDDIGSLVYSFYNRLISGIRSVDQRHIIVYETYGPFIEDYSLPIQARLVNDSNAVLSFHFYHFRKNYGGDISWLRGMFEKWWWNSLENLNVPMWVGEFGALVEDQGSTVWVKDTLQIFREHNLGWAWWAYFKSDNSTNSLLNLNGNVRQTWLQFLALK